MIWLILRRFFRQSPKWVLVLGVLIVSTALFAFWWVRHSAKPSFSKKPAVEDIGPKLALIESNWNRLLLVDNDLYDLDSGKLIFRKWLKNGAPFRLYFDADKKKLVAQYEQGLVRYNLDGSEEAQLVHKEKVAFSDDHKWAVFARAKEVWRADVDWDAFKFTNEKKITSIEQFYETYFVENIQIGTDKTLIVRNMNALLRVNLQTGNVKPTRIPLGDIGKRRSPDSKWVVGTVNGQFYCYDVDADDAKTIPVGRVSVNEFQWLGNDRCLGLAAGKAVVVYDRLANRLTELVALPFPCFKMGEPSPDGRFIFCIGGIGGSIGALVDTMQKTASRVIGGAGIEWVSKDTFASSREVPDSDLRGTWLQIAGQPEKRISPEPYLAGKAGGMIMPLPAAGVAVFVTKHGLFKMTPDGTELVLLTQLSAPPSRLLGIQPWK